MRNREQKLTICDYVAHKEPKKAYDLLRDSGYSFEEPQNCADIARCLTEYVAMDKDAALKKIAEIHPDKELIQSIDREVRDADFKSQATNDMFGEYYNNPFHRGKMIYQNANGCGCGGSMGFNGYGGGGCGCGGNCGRKYNNADGDQKKDYVPLIVAVGFFALLYMIIDKK